jgi:hypothetical protein
MGSTGTRNLSDLISSAGPGAVFFRAGNSPAAERTWRGIGAGSWDLNAQRQRIAELERQAAEKSGWHSFIGGNAG